MSTIGSLIINVSANADALQKGFDDAKSKLKGFAGQIPGIIGSGKIDIGSVLGLAGGAGIGGAGLAAGAMAWVKDAVADFREAKKEASGFGMSMNSLATIKVMGGPEGADAMSTALAHFQKTLAEAATGGEDAQKKFAKLGLDWQELASQPLDKSFVSVAESIKGHNSQLDRAQIAYTLFGKQTKAVLGELQKGAAGFEEAGAKAAKMGKLMSPEQQAGLEGMDHFLKDFTVKFDIRKRELAAYFGQFYEDLNTISGGVKDAGTLRTEIASRQNAATAVDEKTLAEAAAQAKVVEEIDKTIEALDKEAAAATHSQEEIAKMKFGEQGAKPEDMARLEAAFKGVADAKVHKLNEELGKTIEALKVGETKAKAFQMMVDGIDVKEVSSFLDKSYTKQGLEIHQQNLGPLEQAQKKIDELQNLVDLGKIGDEDFAAELAKVHGGIMDAAAPLTGGQLPGALEVGSAAAESFKNRMRNEQENKPDVKGAIDALKEQEKEQGRQALDKADKLLQAMENNKIGVVIF